MKLSIVSLLLLLSLVSITQADHLFDDWPWPVARWLAASIKIGDKMKGKTIDQFQPGNSRVEPAGVVDNHSKWSLQLYDTEVEDGEVTVALKDVQAGTREAFASKKRDYAMLGSQVRYSFVVDDDIMVHFMYDVPFMWYYGNTLSIAVCEKTSSACRKLTAASLMKEDHSFMKRKNFSTDKYPIGVCFDNICVVGSMDFTGRPVIQLAALPRYYHDIDEEERKKCSYLTPEQYERFMTFIPPH